MKPDSMLVEPAHIISARQEIATKGNADALTEFSQAEPALASFLHESLATVAGKLSLSGAPTELVQGSHEELLAVALTCIQALRRAHYELWKGTIMGTRLAQLDKSLRTPRARRKKREGADPKHETTENP